MEGLTDNQSITLFLYLLNKDYFLFHKETFEGTF